MEIHENSIVKCLHLFMPRFEHEFGLGGDSEDSGGFFCQIRAYCLALYNSQCHILIKKVKGRLA